MDYQSLLWRTKGFRGVKIERWSDVERLWRLWERWSSHSRFEDSVSNSEFQAMQEQARLDGVVESAELLGAFYEDNGDEDAEMVLI